MTREHDVVIVGGGPAGAALALALERSDLRIALIEARSAPTAPPVVRPLALSYGSRLIFERIGVWPQLEPATPITAVHISERSRFGRTELTADEARMPALGYVIDYGALVRALDAAVTRSRVTQLRGARVTSIAHAASNARVEYTDERGAGECFAPLVAIADGAGLVADVEVRTIDYRQSALTATVATSRAHGGIAYERFTPEGPIALLPFGNEYALIWTLAPERAAELMDATPGVFLSMLQARFGERAGRFCAVSGRNVHGLTLRIATRVTWGRAVLVGNAAQSLHPVAGQGFNLALRDVWELARAIRREGPGNSSVLESYRAGRRLDRAASIVFTDGLVRIFSNDLVPLAIARGAALAVLDTFKPAKSFFLRRMVFGARG